MGNPWGPRSFPSQNKQAAPTDEPREVPWDELEGKPVVTLRCRTCKGQIARSAVDPTGAWVHLSDQATTDGKTIVIDVQTHTPDPDVIDVPVRP
jgi:hypothetical protein